MTINLNSLYNSSIPGVFVDRISLDLTHQVQTYNQYQNPHLEYMYGDAADYISKSGYWKQNPDVNVFNTIIDPITGKISFHLEEVKKGTKEYVEAVPALKAPGNPEYDPGEAPVSDLVIDVDFTVHSFVKKGKDLISSWVADQNFLDFYRVKYILNTDAALYTEFITAIEDPTISMEQSLDIFPNHVFHTVHELSIHDTGILNMNEESQEEYINTINSVIDDKGNRLYDIPFHSRQLIKGDAFPEHLSIFLIPYLDLKSASQKYNINQSTVKPMFGHPIIELVINNGKSGPEKTIYRERESGMLWVGPAYQMPDGEWVKGCGPMTKLKSYYYTDAQGKIIYDPVKAQKQEKEKFLDADPVSNYTVQDFRPVYEIKKTLARLSQTENSLIGMDSVKLLTNDIVDASFGRKESYFSNIFISRDHDSAARFFFSFDFLSFVKDKSAFKNLFHPDTDKMWQTALQSLGYNPNAGQDVIHDILTSSKILRVRLFRKRAEITAAGSSNLEVHKIKAFSEDKLQSELITEWKPANGSSALRTVDMMSDKPRFRSPYMYHFTGKDIDSINITSGLYFYEIEIEVLDGSVEFAERVFSKIINLRENFNEYYILACQHNPETKTSNYNIVTKKYIPEFFDTLVAKLPLLAAESTRKLALADYIYALTLFYSQSRGIMKDANKMKHFEEQYGNLLDSMVKITNPVTGSPEGVKIILELLDDLITNLERGLDSMISGPTKKAPAQANTAQAPTNRFTDSTRTYKIKYTFDDLEEVFDSCIPKDLGVDYVKTNENFYVSPGLTGISIANLRERVSREVAKYNRGASINVISNAGDGTGPWETAEKSLQKYFPIDMYPLAYTYFTPENISMHDGQRMLSEGIDNDLTFYNDIFTNLVRYEQHLNMEKEPFTIGNFILDEYSGYPSKKAQKFRNNLLDLFSSFGCLVEDMSSFIVPESGQEDPPIPGQNPTFTAKGKLTEPNVFELDVLSEQNSPSKDKTEPQDMLFKLLREKRQAAGTVPETYRLLNDAGQWRSKGAPVAIDVPDFIYLPPQFKILMAYFTQLYLAKDNVGIQGSVKTKDISKLILPKPENQANIIPSVNSFGGVYLNFLDMMELQYLDGYETSTPKGLEEEKVFMKSPIFRKMHNFPFQNTSQFAVSLCRIKRYTNENFHKNTKMINFPVYNEYFFVAKDPDSDVGENMGSGEAGLEDVTGAPTPTGEAVIVTEVAGAAATPFSAEQIKASSVQQSFESVMATVGSMSSVISDLQAQMDAQAVQAELAMQKKVDPKGVINDIITGKLNTSLSSVKMADAAIKSGNFKFSPAVDTAMSAIKATVDTAMVGTPAQANKNKKLIKNFISNLNKGTNAAVISTALLDKTKALLPPAGSTAVQSYKNMLQNGTSSYVTTPKATPCCEELLKRWDHMNANYGKEVQFGYTVKDTKCDGVWVALKSAGEIAHNAYINKQADNKSAIDPKITVPYSIMVKIKDYCNDPESWRGLIPNQPD
tara:strand:+ start:13382 stop:17848 length:4467 start_codon:yes stop_codon:yes gene_type:complete